MSWKGNLRTGLAIARRIEAAEHRRTNIAKREYHAMLKQEAYENVQQAVQQYNDYVILISSTHKETSETIDWNEVLQEDEPVEPLRADEFEQMARLNLASYRPSFFDKLFGIKNKKISHFDILITEAITKDQEVYEVAMNHYYSDFKKWKKYQDFAIGVNSKNPDAYKAVLEYLNPFADIAEIGSRVNMFFYKDYVHVKLYANGLNVIPDFILSQTTTGKMSKKKMPIAKFYELYQDYVCSSVLRIGREMFSFLPVKFVFVNVVSNLLNSSTGHIEEETVLYVAIPKQTLSNLNFETLDASDSMRNFKHNMKFSKTAGFSVVPSFTEDELTMLLC